MTAEVTKTIEANTKAKCEAEKLDRQNFLFKTSAVKVLVAVRPEPLPMDGLLACGTASDRETLATRVLDSNASVTVLVMQLDVVPGQVLRHLCVAIAQKIHAIYPADLLFWSDTETLLGCEEFDQLSAFAADPAEEDSLEKTIASLKASRPAQWDTGTPEMSEAMKAWFEGGDDEALGSHEHVEQSLSELGLLAARGLAQNFVGQGRECAARLTLACTAATVSMSSYPRITALVS
ncbi:hypothetical protein AIOL_002133 [Candidatus Rhodobacter oscarellae]|uniref:Uncharacterized protein n=1 Tax=Candidatus Rhodobacter oscarellae TaxID=1675527 RepID=A0A0J9E3A9_9RHOB|nr:hypothetical protein [Candidatus Rhodobacter lobularis]KMW57172.1 hypothetical protein AIOL_002133 [Candidatus Rhodobacter lobularis]